MTKIISEQIVYDDHLQLEKATLSKNGKVFSRVRLNRPDGAAVLIFNTESASFILTRQYRYGISQKSRNDILEIVAGIIDDREDPLNTVIREAREEVGYQLKKDHLTPISACFASPGYTSEKIYIYYTEVTDADKISDGGGLESENEEIEIVNLPAAEFMDLVKEGKLLDSKSLLAGLWLLSRNYRGIPR
jgi:ADP-ribose pyrophosphatase